MAAPQLFGAGRPIFGVRHTLVTEMVGAFGRLHIGGTRTRFADNSSQLFGIFKHGTRAQMVLVEGLPVVVRHKQRRTQYFKQRFFPDVGIGIVYENARIGIAVGVYVEIPSPTRDTAADIFAVVLEIHRKHRLCRTYLADTVIHILTLCGCRKQPRHGIVADGHIVEIPHEFSAPLHHLIAVFIGAYAVKVIARIATAYAERQLLFTQNIHCLNDLGKRAAAASCIGRFFKSLYAEYGDYVFHPEQLIGKPVVDKCAVRKRHKFAIGMSAGYFKQVLLAYKRLAAGIDIEINAQLLALSHNRIDFIDGQVELIAVFSRNEYKILKNYANRGKCIITPTERGIIRKQKQRFHLLFQGKNAVLFCVFNTFVLQ